MSIALFLALSVKNEFIKACLLSQSKIWDSILLKTSNLSSSNSKLDISLFKVEDSIEYNRSVAELHAELDLLDSYHKIDMSVEEFDSILQKNWHMPKEYKDLDIAEYILNSLNCAINLPKSLDFV
jgi:hypothetical protein